MQKVMNIKKLENKIFEAKKEKMFSKKDFIIVYGILKNNKFSVIKIEKDITNLNRIYKIFTHRFKSIEV
jgi:hypothetical protein